MSWRAPVGEIQRSSVKEVESLNVSWSYSIIVILTESNSLNFSTTLHTGNIWVCASDGSWWVHTDGIIRGPPEINYHFIPTLMTYEGDVLINMAPIWMEVID